MTKTLSKRFIDSYNAIDKALRNIYGYKPSFSFTDCIRMAAANNALISKFEDDLFSYSRLRNAIIHNSGNGKIIAEPHEETVLHIEHIRKMITTPPNVTDVLESKKILVFDSGLTLRDALIEAAKKELSNIPVLENGRILGIITPKSMLIKLGERLYQKKAVDDKFLSSPIRDFLYSEDDEYIFAAANLSVVQALSHFSTDRKLKAIIITTLGDNTAPALQIITSGDIVKLSKILDDYKDF